MNDQTMAYFGSVWMGIIITILCFSAACGVFIKELSKTNARLKKLEAASTTAQHPFERNNLNGLEVKARVLSGGPDSTYFFIDINGIKRLVEVYNLVK